MPTTTDVIRFSGPQLAQEAINRCAQQAERSLNIFSRALTEELWGTDILRAELSRVARRHKLSQVRILTQDPSPLYGHRHAIVDLYRRLPSRIELMRLIEECQKPETGYCIADKTTLCFFNNEAHYEGFYCQGASAEAKHALTEFDYLWQHHSEEDPELKTLTSL